MVEAIVEDLTVKQRLFGELEAVLGPDAILATNTSSLSITAIAAALQRPERLVGMHFFNPVPAMALVEVVSGAATDPAVAETVFATAAAWGKTPVHARSTPGFIVNRVARPFYAEALRVLGEGGGDPATLDAVMRESGGFRMGPFELMDLIGHDVNFAVTRSVFDAFFQDPRFTPSLIQQELVAAGLPRPQERARLLPLRRGRRPARDRADPAGGPAAAAESPAIRSRSCRTGRRIEIDGLTARRHDRRPHRHRAHGGRRRPAAGPGRPRARLRGRPAAWRWRPPTRRRPTTSPALPDCSRRWASRSRALDDVPGMLVMRTVCMLANEAADAVNQGVCDAAAVDTAMRLAVNYPRGPLAWAEAIGLDRVVTVLANLAAGYGEDRYRTSPLLRRRLLAGGPADMSGDVSPSAPPTRCSSATAPRRAWAW